MDRFKAQSSIEFVTVVAIAGLLASPFILQAQQSVLNTDKSSDLSQFESSLDNFVNTMERVDTMGEPARDSVWISVPNKIVDTRVESDAIVYTRNTSSGTTKHVKLTDATINEGTLPTTPGLQKVEIEAWGSGINFSAEEFSSSIFSIQSQSDWNKGIFDGSSADSNDGSDKIGIGYVNSSNPSSTGLEDGLVGYWRLDTTDSGVPDYSGFGNNGALKNGGNKGDSGVFGTNSYNFNNDDDAMVEIPNSSSLDLSDDNEVTLSVWMNVKGTSGGNWAHFFGKSDGGSSDDYGLIHNDYNNLEFRVGAGNAIDSSNGIEVSSSNGWTHVVGTFDGSTDTARLYVNGTEEAENTGVTQDITDNDAPFGIGRSPTSTNRYLNGLIDEGRVYNRALSTSEVKDLYFNGKPYQGDYTSEKIENSDKQEWESLEIQASIQSSNEDLTATFETLKNSLLQASEQEYSLNDWKEGNFNGTTTDNILNERNYFSEYQLSTQKEFNQGDYNLTSADRKDNSGDLGLGYFNGSNPSSTGLEDGLVGYWRLDKDVSGDAGTVKDYSGEGSDGQTDGGVNTGKEGVFGTRAFEFDGSSSVNIDGPVNPDGEDAVTASAWIKSDTIGTDSAIFGTVTGDGGDSNLGIRYDDNGYAGGGTNVIKFAVETGQGSVSGETESDIQTNDWQHVVLRWSSGNSPELFVDGSEVSYTDNPGSLSGQIKVPDIFIGKGLKDTDGWWDGEIDELRIYNKELSQEQIDRLYFNGEPFQGSYTAKRIENNQETSWDKLEVNTTIPSDTSVNATFRVFDSDGNEKDTQFIDLNDGNQNYSLSVDNSEDAEVFINGSSSNPAKSWEIHSVDVLSSEALGLGYLNASNPSFTGLEEALVGYWRFDRSSGNIVDYSSNDNEGVNNGAIRGVKGILETNGFEFNGGNENISVPDSSSLSGNDPATFSFWMKPDEDLSGGTPNDWGFISKQDEFEIGNSNYHSDGSRLAMGIWGDRLTTSKNSWSAGNWYHVAFVVDSANNVFKVYVDGSPDNSKTPGDSIVGASSDLYIGHSEDHSNSFDGEMDEVRIYDRALSDSEIERLYFNGEPFQGSYAAKKIENNEKTVWDKLEITTSVPSETELKAEFEALDSNDNVIDRDYISVDSGTETKNYSLSVQKSENARLSFNGTTSDITKSWSVNSFEIYSKEQQVDESESFEVEDGFNEFSLGLGDSRDARIKLDGSSSDPTQTWSISNITVFTE